MCGSDPPMATKILRLLMTLNDKGAMKLLTFYIA